MSRIAAFRDCHLTWVDSCSALSVDFPVGYRCLYKALSEHDHYKMERIWGLFDIDVELLVEYFKYFSAIRSSRTSPFSPFFLSAMVQI